LRAIDYALHEKGTGRPLTCERKLIESVRYALRRSHSYFVIDDEAPDSFGARPQPKPLTAVLPESVLIPDGTWRVHSLSEVRQCRVRVEPMHAPSQATEASALLLLELRRDLFDAPVRPQSISGDPRALSAFVIAQLMESLARDGIELMRIDIWTGAAVG
jgi:hypothetical protein